MAGIGDPVVVDGLKALKADGSVVVFEGFLMIRVKELLGSSWYLENLSEFWSSEVRCAGRHE